MRTLPDPRRLLGAIEAPGPVLGWTLRRYRGPQVPGDLAAGLSLAAIIAPLSIGFAGIAGLPAEVGLYAAIGSLLGYAVFGAGRRLVVTPDAAGAAIIATALPLAASPDDRIRLAGVLAILVAALFIMMRVARLGFLADFLSRPILVGYLTGVGITVGIGQLATIAGGPAVQSALDVLARVDWTSANPAAVFDATAQAIRASGANLPSLLVGGSVFAAIVIGRVVSPRLPAALAAIVVAIVASAVLDLQSGGVRVLGPVRAGLPPIGIPLAQPAEILALLPGAVAIAILSFTDAAVTGRTVGARSGERVDANRELVGMAGADASAALTGGYPISMSLTRTNESEAAGSSSQMAGVFAAAAMAVILAVLTGPLAFLPMPALGAVALASVIILIDIAGIRVLWRAERSEWAIAMVAMGGVIVYGTLAGVIVAVLLAALNIVRRAAAPPIVEEVRMPEGAWRDAARHPEGSRVSGAIVVRLAGPMFFANAALLQARVRALAAGRPDVRVVVLDFGAIAGVDVTAADALGDLARELERDGRRLAVARPLGHVRDELHGHGLGGLLQPVADGHWSVDAVLRSLGIDPLEALAPRTDVAGPESAGPESAVTAAAVAPGGAPAGGVAGGSGGGAADRTVAIRVLGATAGVVALAAVIGVLPGMLAGTPAPGPVTVPNLLGMTLDRAAVAAEGAGFRLSSPIYVQRGEPEGTVVGQNPVAGTVAERGDQIQPTVSTGRAPVMVPDVVGLPEAEAIGILTSAGLGVARAGLEPHDEVPAGRVTRTEPVAGTQALAGSTVRYVVSAGPASTATPPPAPTIGPSPTPAATTSAIPSVSPPLPTVEPSPSPPTPEPPSAAPSADVPSGEPPSPAASSTP